MLILSDWIDAGQVLPLADRASADIAIFVRRRGQRIRLARGKDYDVDGVSGLVTFLRPCLMDRGWLPESKTTGGRY